MSVSLLARKNSSMITPTQIIDAVSKVTGVGVEDIKRKGRRKRFVDARQISQYIMRQHCPKMKLTDIAEIYGTDHSTIVHGLKRVPERISNYEDYKRIYEDSISVICRYNTEFQISNNEYNIEIKRNGDKLVLNQDGSIIVMTVDNIRQLYLATI